MISRKVSQYEAHVYSLSYRDLEEMMAERGLSLDHSTIARWVLRYAPELSKRLRRHLRRPGSSWRVDETMFGLAARGRTCIVRLIVKVTPSTSCSPPSAIWLPRGNFYGWHCGGLARCARA
jgi:transposase-like protein